MMAQTYTRAATRWIATRQPPSDDQPLDAWLKRELGRTFDDTLCEKLPQELLELLHEVPSRHH
jgi:hypothetical protein